MTNPREYRNPYALKLDAGVNGWKLLRQGEELVAVVRGKEIAVAHLTFEQIEGEFAALPAKLKRRKS